jgi:hypothetical protein
MAAFQPIIEPLQDPTAIVDEKGETYWIRAQPYARKNRKNRTYGDILKAPPFSVQSFSRESQILTKKTRNSALYA